VARSSRTDSAGQPWLPINEADEAFGGMVARMDMPPHARAGRVERGHRFAAYPRCSTTCAEGVPGYEQIGCSERVRPVTRGSVWDWLPAFLVAPVLGILSLILPVFIYRLPWEETSPLFPVLAPGVEHMAALTPVLLFVSGAILGGPSSMRHPAWRAWL